MRPARPDRCCAAALEIWVTTSDSMPVRGLKDFCFTNLQQQATVSNDRSAEGLLLHEPRVDDVDDAVDGKGRLGDVGRHHHLARAGRRLFENL